MSWNEFLMPNKDKLFIFVLLYVQNLIIVSFNPWLIGLSEQLSYLTPTVLLLSTPFHVGIFYFTACGIFSEINKRGQDITFQARIVLGVFGLLISFFGWLIIGFNPLSIVLFGIAIIFSVISLTFGLKRMK